MSRTKKGKKGAGFEYWSRRPTKFKYADPGKETKRNTHRLERQEGKQEARQEESEPDPVELFDDAWSDWPDWW